MRIESSPSPVQVAPERTPSTPTELRTALARAHKRVTGKEATSATLDILTAQVCHETARGEKMYNFNFGGIKGAGPTGKTAACMTRECLDSGDVRIKQNFRAYDSLEQGAVDYLSMMKSRFSSAMSQAERGDVNGFAHALKESHYYTAPEAEYASSLRSLAGKTGANPSTTPSSYVPSDPNAFPDVASMTHFMEAIALSIGRIGRSSDDEDT